MKLFYLLLLLFFLGCKQHEHFPFVVKNQITFDDTTKPYLFPDGITIENSGTLIIKPGIKIVLGKRQNIIVYGTLDAQGTSIAPISFSPQDSLFNRIVFKAGSQKNIISFANITDGAIGIERSCVKLRHINMYFNTIRGTKIAWPVIYSKLGNTEIRNSYITNHSGGWVGEGIVALGGNINIFNSGVSGIPDAIEFTQVNNSTISNVHISKSGDDGIDLNSCQNISIENSTIEDISDKAITIGGAVGFSEIIDSLPTPPSTNVRVSNCLIRNSKFGVAVKDSSEIVVSESAFLNTGTVFKVYEKDKGQGTGKLALRNSLATNYKKFVFDQYPSNFIATEVITDKKEFCINKNDILEDLGITLSNNRNFEYKDFIKSIKLKNK